MWSVYERWKILLPISLLHNRLNVEMICGSISLVGDGALDVPFLCPVIFSGKILISACIWSGIITYWSIFTPGIFSLDNKYFSTIRPTCVNWICGTSRVRYTNSRRRPLPVNVNLRFTRRGWRPRQPVLWNSKPHVAGDQWSPLQKISIFLNGYGWKMNFVYPVGTDVASSWNELERSVSWI